MPLVRVRGIMPIISGRSTSAIGSGSWNNAYHFELSTSAIGSGSWVRGIVPIISGRSTSAIGSGSWFVE